MRCKQHGDGSAELDGEATGRTHLSDLVAESLDDVVAVDPEAETEEETGDDEEPDWGVGFGVDEARFVRLVDSGPWAYSVCDIV